MNAAMKAIHVLTQQIRELDERLRQVVDYLAEDNEQRKNLALDNLRMSVYDPPVVDEEEDSRD